MFVDASALTAMLANEEDAGQFLARLQNARVRITSPLSVWEAVVAVARILSLAVVDARTIVEDFLAVIEIIVVPVPPEARERAIDAYDRYGKSRHPAALNFGDCFAYACASLARVPLLYKGDDFAQTDIETA